MNEFEKLILITIISIIALLLTLLASFIENVFFTLRIKYFNHIQQNKVITFLQKYHLKYTIKPHIKEIWLEKGFLSVIAHIHMYMQLSRFFSDSQTIENAYFQIKYETNNIKITNKYTNKSIININHKDEIWTLVINNISEFLDEEKLINMLNESGYITDKQATILKTEKNTETNKNNNIQNNYARNRRKVLDINNCTLEQLNSLPCITLIIAKKLIKYRNENNGFKSVADFWLYSGLSIRQRITIESLAVIKAKKVKPKYVQTIQNAIQRTIERIIDI